jgi:hypothetical protein
MANKVRMAFKYDGVRYFGAHAVYQLKVYGVHYGLVWDAKKTTWQNCVDVFKALPDYSKRLIVTREPRRCVHGHYRDMLKRNEVPAP